MLINTKMCSKISDPSCKITGEGYFPYCTRWQWHEHLSHLFHFFSRNSIFALDSTNHFCNRRTILLLINNPWNCIVPLELAFKLQTSFTSAITSVNISLFFQTLETFAFHQKRVYFETGLSAALLWKLFLRLNKLDWIYNLKIQQQVKHF